MLGFTQTCRDGPFAPSREQSERIVDDAMFLQEHNVMTVQGRRLCHDS
jgi:hypothetical protein